MGAAEIARRLTILRKAEEDLAQIFVFTIENWGFGRASAYRDLLFGAINRLLKNPARGPSVPDLPLRSVKAGRPRVFYSFDEEEVRILRVLHHAMDTHRHLP